ncbi:MAG: DUF1810 family protein [Pelobium sp.]
MNNELDRFKTAQALCYSQVVKELKNGTKESHWMWYVFPQIRGLGKSAIAKEYEIKSFEEAYEYLTDPTLSKRLRELISILSYDVKGKSSEEIFGFPDYLKFHSSLTLFYLVVQKHLSLKNNVDYACFDDALTKYYNRELDEATVDILKQIS